MSSIKSEVFNNLFFNNVLQMHHYVKPLTTGAAQLVHANPGDTFGIYHFSARKSARPWFFRTLKLFFNLIK